MKKLSKISESFWGDVHKRSRGDEIRKEDDFNLLDLDGFCEYLKKNYKSLINRDVISISSTGWLCVYLYGSPSGFPLFYKDSVINVQPYVMYDLNCSKEIQQKYNTNCTSQYMEISPKDGSPVDNKFFIEVLDYFLEILDRPEVKKDHSKWIEKIKGVKESFWGDVHKRSRGDEIRREDDVNLLDLNEFYRYIKDQYKTKVEYIDLDAMGDGNGDVLGVDITENIILFYKPKRGHILLSWSRVKIPMPFFDELTDRFKVENPNAMRRIITEKDGSCTNKTFVDVIEFFLGHKDGLVNESFWGDVHKRSIGDEVRKEDDINNLDRNEFYDYLTSHYKPTDSFMEISTSSRFNSVSVPIIYKFGQYYIHFSFNPNKVSIWIDALESIEGLFKKMEEKFSLKESVEFDKVMEIISPKDGSEVTNAFFIDVIDFITDNIPNPKERSVKKIMNESFWGDVHKRSRGDEIRKEDDVNLLDLKGFYEYLKSIYKGTDEDIMFNEWIGVCLYEDHAGYHRYIFYDGEHVNTQCDVFEAIGDFSEINAKYSLETFKNDFDIECMDIYPKDRARVPVTNKFFIEVLDYMLSKIKPPLTKQIEKREN